MNSKCIDVMNMKEILIRAKENGILITEYTLRQAIRYGQLPCRIVGRAYLISWNNFISWITCEDGCDNR